MLATLTSRVTVVFVAEERVTATEAVAEPGTALAIETPSLSVTAVATATLASAAMTDPAAASKSPGVAF